MIESEDDEVWDDGRCSKTHTKMLVVTHTRQIPPTRKNISQLGQPDLQKHGCLFISSHNNSRKTRLHSPNIKSRQTHTLCNSRIML